ncbi:MAG: PIN domain-containing protein [Frankiaceae bacterium]|nr:PIN domain-containing protein [Frankiaceae bacterium]
MSATTEPGGAAYLIDTSVLLRAAVDASRAAAAWFEARIGEAAFLAGSRWLATEALRVVVNREVRGEPVDRRAVEEFLSAIDLLALDDEIADQAAQIRHDLRGGDSLHVATALRLARDGGQVVVITHDEKMAAAVRALGLAAHDPVTDDPGRGPV